MQPLGGVLARDVRQQRDGALAARAVLLEGAKDVVQFIDRLGHLQVFLLQPVSPDPSRVAEVGRAARHAVDVPLLVGHGLPRLFRPRLHDVLSLAVKVAVDRDDDLFARVFRPVPPEEVDLVAAGEQEVELFRFVARGRHDHLNVVAGVFQHPLVDLLHDRGVGARLGARARDRAAVVVDDDLDRGLGAFFRRGAGSGAALIGRGSGAVAAAAGQAARQHHRGDGGCKNPSLHFSFPPISLKSVFARPGPGHTPSIKRKLLF